MKIIFKLLIGLVLIFFMTTPAFSQLSKDATKQIESLNREKEARTPVQKKIDSQLLQAIREHKGQKMAEDVDLQPANVHVDANGNLPVDISATVSDSLLNNITRLGGRIIFPSRQYHTIRAQVPLLHVETIAGYAAVTFIQSAAVPVNNGPAHLMQENKLQSLPASPSVQEVRNTLPY